MVAEIRDLGGNIVPTERLAADRKVAECISDLAERNDKGRIKCLIAVYLTPEGWYGAGWAWGDGTYASIGLSGVGALEAVKNEILAAMRAQPDMPDPPDPGA